MIRLNFKMHSKLMIVNSMSKMYIVHSNLHKSINYCVHNIDKHAAHFPQVLKYAAQCSLVNLSITFRKC